MINNYIDFAMMYCPQSLFYFIIYHHKIVFIIHAHYDICSKIM